MYPPGHVAVAWLTASVLPRTRLLLVLIGALLPDVIDKPLWLTGLVSSTRGMGHSLVLWVLLAMVGVRWEAMRFVALGGWSHLAADVVDDVLRGIFHTGTVLTGWLGWPMSASTVWLGWSSAPVPCSWARFLAEASILLVCLVSGAWTLARGRLHRQERGPPSARGG